MWDLEYQETKENGGKWKPIVVSLDEDYFLDFKCKKRHAISNILHWKNLLYDIN